MRTQKELSAHVAEFGVQYASDNLKMEKINIGYRDISYFKTIEHCAKLVPMINCIIFNLDWLESASPNDILKVAFFQTRAAFQLSAIKNPSKYKLDTKTLEAWREDLTSPLEHDEEAYYDLGTTKDAIKFTEELMNQLHVELESNAK